jgi:uncharacterized membrane-anchored protein YitT (DUF2179 family)
MYTATTFPRTPGSSSYQARELFASSHMLSPDIQFVVYAVFFLETVQTALSGADLYYWFAAGFGKTDHLFSSFLTFFDVPIMGSSVALIVQFFFMYRIWVLSGKTRRWWWRCICVMICLVNSFPKSWNDLIILPVAFHCRCIWGVFCRCLRVSPPLHIIDVSQLRQTYLSGAFIEGAGLRIVVMVKSSKDGMDYLSDLARKTWLVANTLSDTLIAFAMLYHVCLFRLLVCGIVRS